MRARIALSILVLLVGCGGGQGSGGDFGFRAEAADADRTVEVIALDTLAFDPEALEVDAGDTITFVISNPGKADHEFVLGDKDTQAGHGGHEGHGANHVHLPPGETAEITWTFDAPGEVLYACHVDGHYAQGMVGTITVT